MKKTVKTLFIVFLFFCYLSKVFASTISWQQITNKWRQWVTDDEIRVTVTSDDNHLNIKDENDVDLIAFNYNNDIVTLVQKDTTSFSEDDKSTYEFTKYIIVVMMIEWVAELYNVNLDDLDENQLTKYGINITTIKNTDDDGNEQDIITNFSIDLNQFESSTKSLQGSTNTDDETTSFSTVEPSVSLQLGKSNSDSIDLIVKVNNLSENSTAKCEIYMISDSGTAFETGQS